MVHWNLPRVEADEAERATSFTARCRSIRGTSDAFIHEGERVASSHVSDIEPLDVKSSRRDEVIDLAVEMTTAAEAFPARRETALPARDGAVWRPTAPSRAGSAVSRLAGNASAAVVISTARSMTSSRREDFTSSGSMSDTCEDATRSPSCMKASLVPRIERHRAVNDVARSASSASTLGRFQWTMKDWLPATVQAAGVERALAPGQSLFRSGDRTAGIYEVLRGEVQMVSVDASGREIILYAASAGEIFAEAALFSPVYRCDAKTRTGATVRLYPKAKVLSAFRQN